MLHRLRKYKMRHETDKGRPQSSHWQSASMSDNAAIQELITQSLEADNDLEDDLDWDTEEASYSAEESIVQANGTNSWINVALALAACTT